MAHAIYKHKNLRNQWRPDASCLQLDNSITDELRVRVSSKKSVDRARESRRLVVRG